MEQTVLTSNQKKLINLVVQEPQLKDFYLSGEALPAMLKHLIIKELKEFFAEQTESLGPEVLQ